MVLGGEHIGEYWVEFQDTLPTSGDFGFWNRTGNTLSPVAADDVNLGSNNATANSFRAGYEQTITASEQTITQTGQNTAAITLSGIFANYDLGSTNPVFNDGTQVGQVMVVKVVDFGVVNTLTIKDDSANGKVNLQGDKFFSGAAGMEDVLIVMWDGSLWQEVYRNLGFNNDFTGSSSGWGNDNEFSGAASGWGSLNDFTGSNSGWGFNNVFSGLNSGWGNNNEFSGGNSGWGNGNVFSGLNSGGGRNNSFNGDYSGWGDHSVANGWQAVFGRYSTDQGSLTSWVATDDLFKIGIGTGAGARADAFRLLKNGESHWETDSKHYFGLANDVSHQFDGSDWIFNSENVTANDEILFTNFTAYRFDAEVEIDGDLNHDGTNIGFFGTAPTTKQTELTDELTSITHTAPGTPDYAIQDLIDSSAGACFGFATKDEGNTVLSVVLNLQTRVNELETKLVAYGLLADSD